VEVDMAPRSTMWRDQRQVGVDEGASKAHSMRKAYMAGWADLDCMGNHKVHGKPMLQAVDADAAGVMDRIKASTECSDRIMIDGGMMKAMRL